MRNVKNLSPVIRFKNFTDDWDQRKLEEVVSYKSSNLTVGQFKELDSFGDYPVYDANNELLKIDHYISEIPYISIIKDGAGVGRIEKRVGKSSVIATMGLLIPRNTDINFIFGVIENINFNKFILCTTIPHIYFKDYGKEKVVIPNKNEQAKIGSLFNELDDVITLHHRKLEKLELMKKYFLKNMFI